MALAVLPLTAIAADNAVRVDPAVQQASYSTGQMGSKLKWLPARPQPTAEVVPAMAISPVAPPAAATEAPRTTSDAFSDPFGDAKAKAASPAPAKLSDNVLEGAASKAAAAPKATVAPTTKPGAGPKLDLGLPSTPPATTSPSDQDLLAVAPLSEDYCARVKKPGPLNRKILDTIKPKAGEFPQSCPMTLIPPQNRGWGITFHWTASALCHKPAYFEEVQVERYGHTWGPWVQPFVSAGHFFLIVPALPYAMGLYPPNECVYTLGYYRVGSCART